MGHNWFNLNRFLTVCKYLGISGITDGTGFFWSLFVFLHFHWDEYNRRLPQAIFAQSISGKMANQALCSAFRSAAAFENSALWWNSEHRKHHKHVDTDDDPYDITKGFFWAHMGWLMFK